MKRRVVKELMAYHEAAHAVVARKLGVEVLFVSMLPYLQNGRYTTAIVYTYLLRS